jgi:hypothetical protein
VTQKRLAASSANQGLPKMSLSFTGDALKTIHTANYRAIGSHGELIIAEASHEAVQDCGEAAVQQKASSKYDEAQVLNNIITVKTSDFR